MIGYETDSDSDDSGLTDHTFQAGDDDSDSGESFMTSASRDRLGTDSIVDPSKAEETLAK